MKIEIEIPDSVIAQTIRQAHCGYWCSHIGFSESRKSGYVVEAECKTKHKINQSTIKVGLSNLAKHDPYVFSKLLENDLDGPKADVVLQYISGVTWEHDGIVEAKYG